MMMISITHPFQAQLQLTEEMPESTIESTNKKGLKFLVGKRISEFFTYARRRGWKWICSVR